MRYRILSTDGGGVGGVLPARILYRLVARRPDLLPLCDLFAGTSTGGIIALALADKRHPCQLVNLYRRDSHLIFRRPLLRSVVSGWGVWRARYAADGLATVLRREFGDRCLGELKRRVLVPSVGVERFDGGVPGRGKFWSNFSGDGDDLKTKIVDVALATSAAPTYFPAHRIEGSGIYWDGGLVANNPTAAAVGKIRSLDPSAECVVLSLGTGDDPTAVPAGDWGIAQSARAVIGVMMSADVSSTTYLAGQAMHGRHHRIDPRVESYGLDDVAAIDRLLAAADAVDLGPTLEWVDKWWRVTT